MRTVSQRGSARLAVLAMAVVSAPAASQAQTGSPAPARPYASYGGFEVPGNLAHCTDWLDAAASTVKFTQTPSGGLTRLLHGSQAVVTLTCFWTMNPQVSRVVVVSASSEAAAADFHRNDLRARVQQAAHGEPVHGVGAAPPALGAPPFITLETIDGQGANSDMSLASQIAPTLDMSAGTATPGHEISLTGDGVAVVVASIDYQPPPGLAPPRALSIRQSQGLVYGIAMTAARASAAARAVRDALRHPPSTSPRIR